MTTRIRPLALSAATLAWAILGHAVPLHAQGFASFPAGDDVTPSLGQFQVVLDPAWVPIFDVLIENSPLGNVPSTKHIRLYHKGVLTSPTLYDPATVIGRSDAFPTGSPQDTSGALAGRAPGRTYVRDSQITVRPDWSEATSGVREVHTFLKSMHLTDSLTTRVGFSVKAGMLAPTRPVSAGQVEGGNPTNDFPARSFFNVFVQVDLPSGGLLPPIQLVNVEPLLVQQTNLFTFPPRLIYQHENSSAVPLYFNNDCVIHDPTTGGDIHVSRGTLFGELTLAGHGVGFSQVEVEAFQAEFEDESKTNSMPVSASPMPSVQIEDFAPDYNAGQPGLSGGHFAADGSFVFTLDHLLVGATNYIQMRTSLTSGTWQTLATIVPATNRLTFVDSDAPNSPQRYYRWSELP